MPLLINIYVVSLRMVTPNPFSVLQPVKSGSSNNITKLDNCQPNYNNAIAEQLANSFASVFTFDHGLTITSIQRSYQSECITFTDNGILKQLQNLDPCKGAGPDNLPPVHLKFLAPYALKTVFPILLCHIKHSSRLAFS